MEAKEKLDRANSLCRRTEMSGPLEMTVQDSEVLPVHTVVALQFWGSVIAMARLKGPRMLGALLLETYTWRMDRSLRQSIVDLLMNLQDPTRWPA
jgi:hypothetical protein